MATRGCAAAELTPDSTWFKGMPFMKKHPDHRPIKNKFDKLRQLPGMKDSVPVQRNVHYASVKEEPNEVTKQENAKAVEDETTEEGCSFCKPEKKIKKRKAESTKIDVLIELDKCQTALQARSRLARVINAVKTKTFKGMMHLTPEAIQAADRHLCICTQQGFNLKRDFKQLKPVLTKEKIYVCGTRLARKPEELIEADDCQILLPYASRWTKLIMQEAHKESGHKGGQSTLAHSRQKYWVSRGLKLAQWV